MEESIYVVDAENWVEASRLLNQDRFVSKTFQLLPPGFDGTQLREVLDLGCGPGGWLLDLATTFPQIHGVGIDIAKTMIQTATLLQRAEKRNIQFQEGDVRRPFPFSENSFDFVHIRIAHAFLTPADWIAIFKECYRVLQPGGWFCVRDLESIHTQKPATEKLYSSWPVVLQRLSRTFSPSGASIGLLAGLPAVAAQTGLLKKSITLHLLDASSGEPDHEAAMENHRVLFKGIEHLPLEGTGITREELEAIYPQAVEEMDMPDFVAMGILFTLLFQKPEVSEAKVNE